MIETWVRAYFVLYYANARQFFGRFDGRWTRTDDLDCAALFETRGEADNARQALLQEAAERIAGKPHAAKMWWDVTGGCVEVQAVDRILKLNTSVYERDNERTIDHGQ